MVPVGLGDAHRYFHMENVWEPDRGGRSGSRANSAGTVSAVSFLFPKGESINSIEIHLVEID